MTRPSARIRKAVLPVAGLGTRVLPATKAVPKEMLAVFDRPAIQYVIDEALDAGVALIEWPQRLEGRLPATRLDIDIALDGDARRAVIVAHGGFEGRDLEF